MARKHRRPGVGVWIAVIAILAVALGGTAFFVNHLRMKSAVAGTVIFPGVTIEGLSVAGKTQEEALEMLQNEPQFHVESQSVVLQDGERSWEIPFSEVDASFTLEKAVQEAYNIGRVGSLGERYKEVMDAAKNGRNIVVSGSYSQEKLDEALNRIQQEYRVEPKDSTISRENGRFAITDEENGYEMNLETTKTSVIDAIESRHGAVITPEQVALLPKVKREDNEKITDLIGSYETTYSLNAHGRNTNLVVGSRSVNGTVLLPGDTFSMNETLGPQTYANGYKDAGVFVNGKVEQGVGGGVCQITTTLYNAVIRAELDVVERSNHSMTVGYVPLGLDAAIAGNYKDLKFKNNTEYPIYIEAYASNGRLVANLYGHEVHAPGRKVEFERVMEGSIQKPPEQVKEDPDLPLGERKLISAGAAGSKVSIYKKVYQNGELISREWFSRSTYRATADEVAVGTKPADEATETASTTDTGIPTQGSTTVPGTNPSEPDPAPTEDVPVDAPLGSV